MRQRFGCSVLIVHHVGHGDKSRARGAIALKAALDAEYRLSMAEDKMLTLTPTKMKDAEQPAPLAAMLETVDLPGMFDDYGNPVSSAALAWDGANIEAIVGQCKAAQSDVAKQRRGKWYEVVLRLARRLADEDGKIDIQHLRGECHKAGLTNRATWRRNKAQLLERGELFQSDDKDILILP